MKKLFDTLFFRHKHVCPWWCCFTFDNPVRKLFHDPVRILSPYVRPGFTAIDIGPGMGFFTIAMCELVGQAGKVIAVDIQQKMLDAIARRAHRHQVIDRLETRLSTADAFGVRDEADFALAFWMVHEVPDKERFFSEVRDVLRPDGLFLLVEPHFHVSAKMFSKTLEAAVNAGLSVQEGPAIAFSKSALLSLPR